MTAATTAPAEAQNSNAPAGAHIDPAAQVAAAGFVPVQTRSERPHSFEPADFGAPTGREVNWKHTPVAQLTSLFEVASPNDGVSYTYSAGEQYIAEPLAVGAAPRGEIFLAEDVTAAVAWQGSAEALHVRIPREEEVAEPVFISIAGLGADRRADAHIVIEALEHSSATVVLQHTGSAQYAQNVEIIVRDGAKLTVISLQQWADDAVHAAAHQARVGADATLKHFVVSFGGGVVRVNPNVELAGAGSEGYLYGLSYADAGQHLESQVYLHHKGPHTKGDVLYKGALQGQGAHSVWIGDVLIGADATGTDSYEANRNLVLTEGARADSIPNLEIETGDILGAGHASATGRFDDEQLFYLQARGITEEEARRLVVLGFLTDIVQRLGIPALETELLSAIETELAEVSA
ncbi:MULTISPECIES: Fe-S cluster assembly protein SufD [unclassified Microbacterium]|uniref:Fe-S cluster assembly protein SufD n=1 Tax=unclassified Microbacterium TaxID=2609290 RepID=UPI000CFC0209|nr:MULTISPECIES: Fe-S cluster assembly protein SufD [unclassified Microbacterium]PQZ60633.1 Fe-S cluster assembly protein SufD [Microbacterium sp. MYb43]PQZ82059.1 Fe-S cluster assembly protein SufD [Microbacterium sp. MYb40]PRB22322.1 Fe-S cluster assembly protein SufD [Microbacterium sp. MYb54]PRB31113.1 Fe-S cluster assembly protein SufD [Microbacterium sp. MYb50]PRB69722.1 Fe-S cluster assembly protein SufD [Microbacterium sp. MYb24]